MASHSQAEVAAALNHLLTGNGGNPLNWNQFVYEIDPEHGTAFGQCLFLAVKNPDLFPDVLLCPFMQRAVIPRLAVISGNTYAHGWTTSCDAAGEPNSFVFFSCEFANAPLV